MKITAVIVTYNRLACLQQALPLYSRQHPVPATVLVVDNHSTDGTAEYLKQWQAEGGREERIVLTLGENTGGAGGFAAGMERALQTDCDWIWVSDDDAYLRANTFFELNLFAEENPAATAGAAALCTAVMDNGVLATGNRCRVTRTLIGAMDTSVPTEEYSRRYFELDSYSFVGVMFRKSALQAAGLPHKEYFIYHDDMEHSVRMRQQGKLLCVPTAVVDHNGGGVASNEKKSQPTWRDYYATRNLLLAYKEHHTLPGFYWRALRRFVAALLTGNGQRVRLYTAAIRDAAAGRAGLHPVYRPGWSARTAEKQQ